MSSRYKYKADTISCECTGTVGSTQGSGCMVYGSVVMAFVTTGVTAHTLIIIHTNHISTA